MKNLKEVIKKLNAPSYIDDEMYESSFNFKIKTEKGLIYLYDANENYHIDYLEEQNALMYDACMEFGFKFKPLEEDKIASQLTEAIKKDFGENAYIEWYDNVEMIIAK